MKKFMNKEVRLTVDGTKKFLEKLIESRISNGDFKLSDITETWNINLPLARTTVWRWMRQFGAKYEAAKKCHYTDNHDAEATVEYRNRVYLPMLRKLSERMPLWVKDDSFYHNGQTCVHVDQLEENLYLAFRKKKLKETGLPGKFFLPKFL